MAFNLNPEFSPSPVGCFYYGFRYYSAGLGRWINRDALEESGGTNLYLIANNNPQKSYDYLGLVSQNFDLVAKSFIAPIGGNIGSFSALSNILFPGANLRLGIFASITDAAYSEVMVNDAQDKAYRMFSKLSFTASCSFEDGIKTLTISPESPNLITDVGFEPASGGISPPNLIVNRNTFQRQSDSFYTFAWTVSGRPHNAGEFVVQAVHPRTNRYIWHKLEGSIVCDSSCAPELEVDTFDGSSFPSHTYWENGESQDTLPQGPLADLWILSSP